MKEQLEAWLALLATAKEKVADGLPKRALKLLRQADHFPDPEQDILRLVSRWGVNERQKMEGTLTEDEFRKENNLITKDLLRFLGEQERKLKAELQNSSGEGDLDQADKRLPPAYEGKAQILLLYAQEDLAHWKALQKHFFMFQRDKGLQLIDIHEDVPLAVIDTLAYQQKMLAAAHLVLCIVTPNTMSEPIFSLAEQAAGKLVPLRFEEVSLEDTPFRKEIKGLPVDGRFVDQWSNANAAFKKMAEALRPVFQRLKDTASQ